MRGLHALLLLHHPGADRGCVRALVLCFVLGLGCATAHCCCCATILVLTVGACACAPFNSFVQAVLLPQLGSCIQPTSCCFPACRPPISPSTCNRTFPSASSLTPTLTPPPFPTLAGKGVYGFTLDPLIGEFVLSHPDIKIPEKGEAAEGLGRPAEGVLRAGQRSVHSVKGVLPLQRAGQQSLHGLWEGGPADGVHGPL